MAVVEQFRHVEPRVEFPQAAPQVQIAVQVDCAFAPETFVELVGPLGQRVALEALLQKRPVHQQVGARVVSDVQRVGEQRLHVVERLRGQQRNHSVRVRDFDFNVHRVGILLGGGVDVLEVGVERVAADQSLAARVVAFFAESLGGVDGDVLALDGHPQTSVGLGGLRATPDVEIGAEVDRVQHLGLDIRVDGSLGQSLEWVIPRDEDISRKPT